MGLGVQNRDIVQGWSGSSLYCSSSFGNLKNIWHKQSCQTTYIYLSCFLIVVGFSFGAIVFMRVCLIHHPTMQTCNLKNKKSRNTTVSRVVQCMQTNMNPTGSGHNCLYLHFKVMYLAVAYSPCICVLKLCFQHWYTPRHPTTTKAEHTIAFFHSIHCEPWMYSTTLLGKTRKNLRVLH